MTREFEFIAFGRPVARRRSVGRPFRVRDKARLLSFSPLLHPDLPPAPAAQGFRTGPRERGGRKEGRKEGGKEEKRSSRSFLSGFGHPTLVVRPVCARARVLPVTVAVPFVGGVAGPSMCRPRQFCLIVCSTVVVRRGPGT